MIIYRDIEQNSDEWMNLRCGLPTASSAAKIITSTGKPSKQLSDYAKALAGDKYAGKQLDAWEGNRHTERGHELEPAARSYYSMIKDVDVDVVAFVTDEFGDCGVSPDGLVGNDGLVEIKCLSTAKHIEAIQKVDAKKVPSTYIPQVQMQMLICERDWCDLIFYSDELPSEMIRVKKDAVFHAALQAQLDAVIAERNLIVNFLTRKAA